MLTHIFDSHSHYDSSQFDGIRYTLLDEMFENGLAGIIHASTDYESAVFGIETAKRYERFYTSIGFHPEGASRTTDADLKSIYPLVKENKVVAVGEIGLDYHYEGYDRDRQIYLFKEQIKLALDNDLPVIVHSREATLDTMEILSEFKPRGVVHCFSGSAETAKEVLALGMYIGLTGVVTFKNNKKAKSVLEVLPPERFLLETDCPYMAPEPFRGKTCISSMIEHTAKKSAEIMGLSTEELLEITERNVKTLFNIE